jgi:hypothetical protein
MIIAYCLIAVIVFQQILFARERKDLYNRIMAKDLTELKAETPGKRSVPNMIRKRLQQQKG